MPGGPPGRRLGRLGLGAGRPPSALMPSRPQQENGRRGAAVATSWGRRFVVTDAADSIGRRPMTPTISTETRSSGGGSRGRTIAPRMTRRTIPTAPAPTAEDLPVDEPPRTDGEYVYGDPDPMFRLGRVGEVRGTMTGRVELDVGLERLPPRRDVTGCRTRGEDELRVLGRDDVLRAIGREEELRVLGRLRPLDDTLPAFAGGCPWTAGARIDQGSGPAAEEPPPEDPNPGR